jgi:hypothetical protein
MQPFDKPLESTERADYLDTQTLAGGEGYFHTENAPTHRTDGTAVNPDDSGETPLVRASRGESTSASNVSTTVAQTDDFEDRTNADLKALAEQRGLDVPPRANKAALVALLRGE